MLGVALALSAALGFGSTAVFARIGLQYIGATTGTLVSLVVSTVIAFVVAIALHPQELFGLDRAAYLWLALAGILTFPMGRLLNYTGVHLAGVSRATPVVGTSPLFAVVLAVTFAGESVNLPMLLGMGAIIGGLVLILSQQ